MIILPFPLSRQTLLSPSSISNQVAVSNFSSALFQCALAINPHVSLLYVCLSSVILPMSVVFTSTEIVLTKVFLPFLMNGRIICFLHFISFWRPNIIERDAYILKSICICHIHCCSAELVLRKRICTFLVLPFNFLFLICSVWEIR